MKFALCNEMCEGWKIEDVFQLAAKCGYDGVEIAPFTLARSVVEISKAERRRIRKSAEEAGVEIAGLHWLLVSPEGLYINHPDPQIRRRTHTYFEELIRFCAELGGRRMVIGSPKQRNILEGQSYEETWRRTVDFFRELTPLAGALGVILGMEPLARSETNFLNTKDEVMRLIREVSHPNFRLTLDCKAMTDEQKPIPRIIEEAGEYLVHFHANDDNRGYPGSGKLDFVSIFHALMRVNYEGWVSIEVFDFTPGPERIARDGIAHLKACMRKASELTNSKG